ncbi:hypothetical protein [Pleionea sp. CnH1-48]|uniref:hypothetical protein n=1 Tax=Pleionea sp. CnH1-48 TaxID=2954494 RepID=UPI002097D355|nr:hypothetical protein [Pleionea sp. CnH1-48]MCO7226669.1 hypothetical protein [Pleionea sp. CnH1-48]
MSPERTLFRAIVRHSKWQLSVSFVLEVFFMAFVFFMVYLVSDQQEASNRARHVIPDLMLMVMAITAPGIISHTIKFFLLQPYNDSLPNFRNLLIKSTTLIIGIALVPIFAVAYIAEGTFLVSSLFALALFLATFGINFLKKRYRLILSLMVLSLAVFWLIPAKNATDFSYFGINDLFVSFILVLIIVLSLALNTYILSKKPMHLLCKGKEKAPRNFQEEFFSYYHSRWFKSAFDWINRIRYNLESKKIAKRHLVSKLNAALPSVGLSGDNLYRWLLVVPLILLAATGNLEPAIRGFVDGFTQGETDKMIFRLEDLVAIVLIASFSLSSTDSLCHIEKRAGFFSYLPIAQGKSNFARLMIRLAHFRVLKEMMHSILSLGLVLAITQPSLSFSIMVLGSTVFIKTIDLVVSYNIFLFQPKKLANVIINTLSRVLSVILVVAIIYSGMSLSFIAAALVAITAVLISFITTRHYINNGLEIV